MNPPDSEATIAWRMTRVEMAVDKLDDEKADAKDMARMADEFKSLRLTLQWFMGIVALAVIALAGIVVQISGG